MIKARGLEKVRPNNYLNATLQCLYHVKPLSEKLINDDKISEELKITYCYKELIEELTGLTGCTNRGRFKENLEIVDYAKPIEYKDSIIMQNYLINSYDSEELISSLLDKMDDELTMRNNNSIKPMMYSESYKDIHDGNYKKYHNSIISELFFGFHKIVVICEKCKNQQISFSNFDCLLFPLEEVYNSLNQQKKNIKSKNNLNNNNNCRKLNLDNCFKHYESGNSLSGDTLTLCNVCGEMREAKIEYKLYKAPKVLILILNRGKNKRYECNVDFPQKLIISNYFEYNDSSKIYNLIGVISNLGKNTIENHIIAFCKHFDGTWRLFNDASVSNSSDEDIKKETSHILFYQSEDI